MTGYRTTLSDASPYPLALDCPFCGRFANLRPWSSAKRQLSSHISKAHRGESVEWRWCVGPSHERPAFLRLSEFNRRGQRSSLNWRRECRTCEQLNRRRRIGSNSGWLPAAVATPFVVRLVEIYGSQAEAARRACVSSHWIFNIVHGKTRFVRRDVLAKVLVALRAASA